MIDNWNGLVFVDVNVILNPTHNPSQHKTSLSYSDKTKKVLFLGGIPHGTELVLNQELIDDLQKVLNIIEKNTGE